MVVSAARRTLPPIEHDRVLIPPRAVTGRSVALRRAERALFRWWLAPCPGEKGIVMPGRAYECWVGEHVMRRSSVVGRWPGRLGSRGWQIGATAVLVIHLTGTSAFAVSDTAPPAAGEMETFSVIGELPRGEFGVSALQKVGVTDDELARMERGVIRTSPAEDATSTTSLQPLRARPRSTRSRGW